MDEKLLRSGPIFFDKQQQDSDQKAVQWWFDGHLEEDHFLGGDKTMITVVDTQDSLHSVEQEVSLNFLRKFVRLLKHQPECMEDLYTWLCLLDKHGYF